MDEIKEMINHPNATLLDVREAEELETEGSVEGAIHIPLGEVPEKIEEIEGFSKPLVIFCRSGNRSGRAIQFLESNHGMEELYNGGGFRDVNQMKD